MVMSIHHHLKARSLCNYPNSSITSLTPNPTLTLLSWQISEHFYNPLPTLTTNPTAPLPADNRILCTLRYFNSLLLLISTLILSSLPLTALLMMYNITYSYLPSPDRLLNDVQLNPPSPPTPSL